MRTNRPRHTCCLLLLSVLSLSLLLGNPPLSSACQENPGESEHPFLPVANSEEQSDASSAEKPAFPFRPLGGLVLVGGGGMPAEARSRFVEMAGGEAAKIVIIPTASAYADTETEAYWTEPWSEYRIHSIGVLHTRDRTVADSDEFCQKLELATGIWFSGGDQNRIAEAYLGTRAEQIIESLPHRQVADGAGKLRGGVVGGTSAGSAIASRIMIGGGREEPRLTTGLNLLPLGIVDQHFSQREREGRLLRAVQQHPEHIGIGIDERTAAVFRGRFMQVVGRGSVKIVMAGVADLPDYELSLPSGATADWTTLIRTNHERRTGKWSRSPTEVRFPSAGSLVIVGGGGMPNGLIARFVELAGGDQARIVILPTALDPPSGEQRMANSFLRAGAASAIVLPQTSSAQINSPEFRQALGNATGIWFGGGRQWRFVDHYEGTDAVTQFHSCLQRGGVIGGSSAGASIQGELLIRGAPVGNQIMVQDGYRYGFGFFPGIGIDQHFSQRNRLSDLQRAIGEYPEFTGVGIDEATALIVTPDQAEVFGNGRVFVVRKAAELPPASTQPEAQSPTEALPASDREATIVRIFEKGQKLTLSDFQ
jgi:cyanophycinase